MELAPRLTSGDGQPTLDPHSSSSVVPDLNGSATAIHPGSTYAEIDEDGRLDHRVTQRREACLLPSAVLSPLLRGQTVDQRELARRLNRMERVVSGHAYASCSSLNLIERVMILLRRSESSPPGPADSPGVRLVRAAIATADPASAAPEFDCQFWATIREILTTRASGDRIESLL